MLQLSVTTAQCDAQGWLLDSAYLDLRKCDFFKDDEEIHSHESIESSIGGLPRPPGVLLEELDDLSCLEFCGFPLEGHLRGWHVMHPIYGSSVARTFGLGKWKSLRLSFVLAKLQRDVWAQGARNSGATLLRKLFQPAYREQAQEMPAMELHAGSTSRVKKRRLTLKSHHSGLSEAAFEVFRQPCPLFTCWLGNGLFSQAADFTDLGVNPSPFDIHALFCTHRLFSFLHEKNARASSRMFRKGPLLPKVPSILEYAADLLAVSCRGNCGLQTAVMHGDMDATRFHLVVKSESKEKALNLAVQLSKPSIVRLLITGGVSCRGIDGAPVYLYEALSVWMRSPCPQALEVLKLLVVAPGTDLEAAVLPQEPGIGDWKAHTFYHKYPRRRVSQLPFLQQGDSPLSWAMRAHAALSRKHDPRLEVVVRLLLRHGANPNALNRRQQKSMQQFLEPVGRHLQGEIPQCIAKADAIQPVATQKGKRIHRVLQLDSGAWVIVDDHCEASCDSVIPDSSSRRSC